MALRPGDHLEQTVAITSDDVVRLATELGDPNPLHHDAAAAVRSRFGGLIACGGHVIGLLTSACAAFTSPHGPGVGLGFTYTLRKAARAGERFTMRWEVLSVERSERLRGNLVRLRGTMRDAAGALVVEGAAEVLQRADLG